MNKKSLLQHTAVIVTLTILLNTLAVVWSGAIQHHLVQQPLIKGLVLFSLYIALNELWQVAIRIMYACHKQFKWKIYYLKLFVSGLFILIISLRSSWLIGLILVMYEAFQFFMFRNQERYIDTLFYPIASGCFKGFILNTILIVGVPFVFQLATIRYFILPTIIFMIAASVEQQIYGSKEVKGQSSFLFIIFNGLLLIISLWFNFTGYLSWWITVMEMILSFALLKAIKQTKHQLLLQDFICALYSALIIVFINL